MRRFAEDVHVLDCGARVALFHARTGRHAVIGRETLAELRAWTRGLPPPPSLTAVARRLHGLHLLAESAAPPLEDLVPARSRRALLLPDVPALWLPRPWIRTPGGHAYAERALDPHELAIWRACNGSRSTAAVAEITDTPLAQVLALFADLTHPDMQALQLRTEPVRARDLSLERLVCPERPPAARPAHLVGADGATTLTHYHLTQIDDGDRHFDDRETTVAHAFAVAHPGLGGLPYGARLHEVLENRGHIPRGTCVTLEIGPGDGELGEAFRDRASRRGLPSGEHIRLDQSPTLLETQRRRQPGTREILGSATAMPLPDQSVDLILCNEVLADLSAVPLSGRETHPSDAQRQVMDRLARYHLHPLESESDAPLYNLGAWQLVEEVARVLRPGGVAWLSEFGGPDDEPQETEQLDHPEVSIHFGHLIAVARELSLSARLEPLADFLDADLSTTWLARHSHEALRARMRAQDRHLAARAWTPDGLDLPWRVEGLTWVPLSDEGPGPLITRFWCVTLRR